MRCEKCQQAIPINGVYCRHCGNRIATEKATGNNKRHRFSLARFEAYDDQRRNTSIPAEKTRDYLSRVMWMDLQKKRLSSIWSADVNNTMSIEGISPRNDFLPGEYVIYETRPHWLFAVMNPIGFLIYGLMAVLIVRLLFMDWYATNYISPSQSSGLIGWWIIMAVISLPAAVKSMPQWVFSVIAFVLTYLSGVFGQFLTFFRIEHWEPMVAGIDGMMILITVSIIFGFFAGTISSLLRREKTSLIITNQRVSIIEERKDSIIGTSAPKSIPLHAIAELRTKGIGIPTVLFNLGAIEFIPKGIEYYGDKSWKNARRELGGSASNSISLKGVRNVGMLEPILRKILISQGSS
jgi:hypothetical protein